MVDHLGTHAYEGLGTNGQAHVVPMGLFGKLCVTGTFFFTVGFLLVTGDSRGIKFKESVICGQVWAAADKVGAEDSQFNGLLFAANLLYSRPSPSSQPLHHTR